MARPLMTGAQGRLSALDLHPKILYVQGDRVLYEIARRLEARRPFQTRSVERARAVLRPPVVDMAMEPAAPDR